MMESLPFLTFQFQIVYIYIILFHFISSAQSENREFWLEQYENTSNQGR